MLLLSVSLFWHNVCSILSDRYLNILLTKKIIRTMKKENITEAIQAQINNAKSKLNEDYCIKLDNYVSRVTNPQHLLSLLQEEDLVKALDEREAKRKANQNYKDNKSSNDGSFLSLFKTNMDIDLSSAGYEDLETIEAFMNEKIVMIKELMNSKRAQEISDLEARIAMLKKMK